MPYHDILAARFYSPHPASPSAPLDILHVRDLVLDCHIGVHAEEQGVTQRVRFTVEVAVYPSPRPQSDRIEDVLCYGSIVAGITRIIAEGHINLVETLAERIAAFCLEDRRAARARVRIEKLDRFPGASVGVEIVRHQRPVEDAKVCALHRPGAAE